MEFKYRCGICIIYAHINLNAWGQPLVPAAVAAAAFVIVSTLCADLNI